MRASTHEGPLRDAPSATRRCCRPTLRSTSRTPCVVAPRGNLVVASFAPVQVACSGLSGRPALRSVREAPSWEWRFCSFGGTPVSRRGKILSLMALIVAFAAAFVYAQVDIATKSIQFDLRKIGQSVYEAHSKTGKWPAQIADLEGAEYLKMPHRRTMLQEGAFVVVWQQDLDLNPEANANRVLAYDNSSLLSRFGRVWVCLGDLRIERMGAKEMRALNLRRQ
jgi:hypothetical protein